MLQTSAATSLLSFFFDIMQWYEMFMNYKKLVDIVPYKFENIFTHPH